jgi:hypothetical protein
VVTECPVQQTVHGEEVILEMVDSTHTTIVHSALSEDVESS